MTHVAKEVIDQTKAKFVEFQTSMKLVRLNYEKLDKLHIKITDNKDEAKKAKL